MEGLLGVQVWGNGFFWTLLHGHVVSEHLNPSLFLQGYDKWSLEDKRKWP